MSELTQWLIEALLGHGVDMLRVEAEVRARVIALLVSLQRDLVSLLSNADELSAMNKAAKAELLRQSNALIADYYGRAQLQVDLHGIAEVEAQGVRKALSDVLKQVAGNAAAEVRAGIALPTDNYLRKLAGDVLIQGSPAKNWWLRQSQDTQFKIANEIRLGAAQGETNAQIIRRVVGADAKVVQAGPTAKAPPGIQIEPGAPGVMPLARKNAAAVVQTSMATVAAAARRETLKLNADITVGIMQVSTLDSHTSLTCIAYSGAQWDHDLNPINGNDLPYNGGVPRHWNCRSSEVAIMKTLREMGIDMDEPDPGQRASAPGPISAKTTFAEYLKQRGADYQDEVLGKGRAELFRAGKLAPRDLVDMGGQPLRLEQLRAKYEKDFRQPKGEFTIYDPGYKRVAPDTSTPARAAAVKLEDRIRRDSQETGAVFAPDGRMLVSRQGVADSVAFTRADFNQMAGNLFTHNHPGNGTLSLADVRQAARYDIGELRAVGPTMRYIMTAPEGWPTRAQLDEAKAQFGPAIQNKIDVMIEAGELTAQYAQAEIDHQFWVMVAKAFKLKYTREAS